MAWTARIDGYHIVLSMSHEAIGSDLTYQFVRSYAKEHSLSNAQNFVAGPRDRSIVNQAADWELSQCCAALEQAGYDKLAVQLRWLRRPLSPAARLKEAERLIEQRSEDWRPSPAQWETIREALREARYALTDGQD